MQRLIIEVPHQRPADLWRAYSDHDLLNRTTNAMDHAGGWSRHVYCSEQERAGFEGAPDFATLRAQQEDPEYLKSEEAILRDHGALVEIWRGTDDLTLTWPGSPEDVTDVELALEFIGHDAHRVIVVEAPDLGLDDAALMAAARAELDRHKAAGHTHCHQCSRIQACLEVWIESETPEDEDDTEE